ncbi:MAG: DUF790 family protein [Polyangiales bacterium]
MIRLRFDRGTVVVTAQPRSCPKDVLDAFLLDGRDGNLRALAASLREIEAVCARHSMAVALHEATHDRVISPVVPPSLRGYQSAALAAWEVAGRRGVIVLPTGAGKTRVAVAAIARVRRPTLCVVPTRVLLHQWAAALEGAGFADVGRLGDGCSDLRDVTVATFESAYRAMPRIGDRFDLLVVDEVLAQAAQELGLDVDDLERMMFADFARERHVEALPSDVGAPDVVSLANLALVQGIVARSAFVRMQARSGARDLTRHVRLVGLMHVVTRDHDHQDGFVIEVSGPLSIFRSTRLYARALSSIVPRLAWCRGFALEAHLHVGGQRTAVQIREGDPIRPSRRPAPFDSKLEARFARDFTREAADYELVREPAAIEVDAHLVFPDFAVVHRTDAERHGLVEIVGFYTQDYLSRKLAQMRNERLSRLVLCIDESLQVSDSDLPRHAQVVRFKKRVSVMDVIQAIERLPEHHATGQRGPRS